MKSETNSKLPYIHHKTHDTANSSSTFEKCKHEHEIPVKLQESIINKPSCSKNNLRLKGQVYPTCSKVELNVSDKVVKIYERKQQPDTPQIKIINEKKCKNETNRKQPKSRRDHKLNSKSGKSHVVITEQRSKEMIDRKSSTKLALFQVSAAQSSVSSDFSSFPHLVRSRSFPNLFLENPH